MVPNVDMNTRLTPTPPLKKEKKKKKRGKKCRGGRVENKRMRSVKEGSGWTTWEETTRGSGKRKRRGFWRRGRRSDGFCLYCLGCLLHLQLSANHSAYYSEFSRDGSSNIDSGANQFDVKLAGRRALPSSIHCIVLCNCLTMASARSLMRLGSGRSLVSTQQGCRAFSTTPLQYAAKISPTAPDVPNLRQADRPRTLPQAVLECMGMS